ncbi:matrix metalloproteinase-17-like [Ciona intestinalis]
MRCTMKRTPCSSSNKHNGRPRTKLSTMRSVALFITSYCHAIAMSSASPVSRLHEITPVYNSVPAEVDSGVNFLVKYGYLAPHDRERSENDLMAATSKFQRMYGLTDTGLLDEETLYLMQQPRCGLWDVPSKRVDLELEISNTHVPLRQSVSNTTLKPVKATPVLEALAKLSRKKRYTLMGHWPSKRITYGFRMYTDDMSTLQQQDAVARALDVWSKNTPLVFTQQWQKDVDIMISFPRGYHNDGYPFDGPGHTLAHAFYPGQGLRSGDVHFDGDEKWTYMSQEDGTSLFMVAVHEFGHALGLGHSTSKGSVMLPFYQGYKEGISLSSDDIQAIYTLYGSEKQSGPLLSQDDPFVFASPTLGSTRGIFQENNKLPITQSPELCEKEFDAVANIRSDIYFFRGNYFWRILKDGRDDRIKMSRFWTNFPNVNVDAAYSRDEKTFFFSGTRYWAYSDTNMVAGSPRPISDFGLPMDGGIDAAMIWDSNGGTYFFRGERFWKYDEDRRQIELGYPRNISVLRDVPANIDAALSNPSDRSVYFLKGTRCWKLDDDLLSVSKGYPEYIGVTWFGCDRGMYSGVREPDQPKVPHKGSNHTTSDVGNGRNAAQAVVGLNRTVILVVLLTVSVLLLS